MIYLFFTHNDNIEVRIFFSYSVSKNETAVDPSSSQKATKMVMKISNPRELPSDKRKAVEEETKEMVMVKAIALAYRLGTFLAFNDYAAVYENSCTC